MVFIVERRGPGLVRDFYHFELAGLCPAGHPDDQAAAASLGLAQNKGDASEKRD
jgi:hypothetical protein